MVQCLICNQEFKNNRSLANHVRQTHKIDAMTYHTQYLHENWITESTHPDRFISCPVCDQPYIELSIHLSKIHHWSGTQRGLYLIDKSKFPIATESELVQLFEKLYINDNHSLEEVRDILGLSIKLLYSIKSENNITKPIELSESARLAKIKATCLERYGVTSSTLINNQERTKQTYRERYGVDWNFQTDEFKKMMKETSLLKYGTSHPHQSQIVIDKTKQTCMERYGVTTSLLTPEIVKARHISKSQLLVYEIMKVYNDDVELEFAFGNSSYDIKVGNVLIEVDPTYTHNSTKPTHFNPDYIVPYNYHLLRTENAEEHGYQCIHIFDWDNPELISKLLSNRKTRIYARKCEVKLVTDRNLVINFINSNHLQGASSHLIGTKSISIGLYYNNELVSIMSFDKPRYNKNYQYELLRLCSNLDYEIIGGNAKLFKYFINNYNPESIISYCDKSKFTGKVYQKLGFKLHHSTHPTQHWDNGVNHYTDALLRSRGADQLLGTNYGKGTDNESIMIENGYLQVYDCGQDVYEYIN